MLTWPASSSVNVRSGSPTIGPFASLLPALADRMTDLSGVRPGTPCAALGAAVRLWLRQDPARLMAGLRTLHGTDARCHHPQPVAQPVAA